MTSLFLGGKADDCSFKLCLQVSQGIGRYLPSNLGQLLDIWTVVVKDFNLSPTLEQGLEEEVPSPRATCISYLLGQGDVGTACGSE